MCAMSLEEFAISKLTDGAEIDTGLSTFDSGDSRFLLWPSLHPAFPQSPDL